MPILQQTQSAPSSVQLPGSGDTHQPQLLGLPGYLPPNLLATVPLMKPVESQSMQAPIPIRPIVTTANVARHFQNSRPRAREVSEDSRLDDSRLPPVMEHEEATVNGQGGSSSGSDEEHRQLHRPSYIYPPASDYPDSEQVTYTPTTSVFSSQGAYTPATSTWGSYSTRSRDGNAPAPYTVDGQVPPPPQLLSGRPGAPLRTPSSTYKPNRTPSSVVIPKASRQSTSSRLRGYRSKDPNVLYSAQEKLYIDSLKKHPADWPGGPGYAPSQTYSTDDDTEDESPSTSNQFDDPFDPDTLMFVGNDDNAQPTEEELQIPGNRERLEWHTMLASVLRGDVVRQEKQRLIGTSEQKTKAELGAEIWWGAKANYYGRTVPLQKKLAEEGRSKIGSVIESLINFEIKGETVVGKSPLEQVEEAVEKIDKIEWLYQSRRELEADEPRAATELFRKSCDAITSWYNITQVINTEVAVLQAWVGNPELDFTKTRAKSESEKLADDASFIDRLLKEDGLKSLQGKKSMFIGINDTIKKAKQTLIENAEAFGARHLPPYNEELLTVINFPSRLIADIIKTRLSYATKMKESAQSSVMILDQMIEQFQILMQLACLIKREYVADSAPQAGWDLPPCLDEGFDETILEALRFYFKMLNWKLGANRNTFREAEILEQEWGFSNEIGRQLDGGDIEVAEQFSALTAKALLRLLQSFDKEFQTRNDESTQDMEKRYKALLDSVRVRQRKLFRFSKLLRQRFENAAEFNLSMDSDQLEQFTDVLVESGHFLLDLGAKTPKGVHFLASVTLWNRAEDIQSMLGTSFHSDNPSNDPAIPYILAINPEGSFQWDGPSMTVEAIELPSDVRTGRIRLIADGTVQRLVDARNEFTETVNQNFEVVNEYRANLSRVNQELGRIKKNTFRLSATIMESVDRIRKKGSAASTELIQSIFAFATEFGKRSLTYMDANRQMMNTLKLTQIALEWISFICDDCDAADKRTFKWAVTALEFAMAMTRGRNILEINDEQYAQIRTKVAGCMSVLISHFDIMGARSTLAAQQEKVRSDAANTNRRFGDLTQLRDDAECYKQMCEQRLLKLQDIDQSREDRGPAKTTLGRVLEGSNETDRYLTFLSSSATNVTVRWQQGRYVGGGTFGSVYAAINLDSGALMAVKEIRLQDPQAIPSIAKAISDEMDVLASLDHPNVVSYYGIEVHRDKVYIFMEYCSNGSMANLLEHGRIEDETVIMVYALQLLEGLAYLHKMGVVHRDIKPENVLLDDNGVIKYVDFGAAKVIARKGQTMVGAPSEPSPLKGDKGQGRGDAQGKAGNAQGENKAGAGGMGKPQGTMTGTPMYMSPEVIRGDKPSSSRVQGAADIWSLGCVILEMATGRRPWSTLDNEWAIMYNIAQGNPPQFPAEDQLSEMGVDFLKRCFERNPEKRSTAAELLQHPWIVEIRKAVVDESPDSAGSMSRSETWGSTSSASGSASGGERSALMSSGGWSSSAGGMPIRQNSIANV